MSDSPARTRSGPSDTLSSSSEPDVQRPLPRLLCAVNFRLPHSDYRLMHGRRSRRVEVVFGLPESPDGLPSRRFRRIPLGEGLSVRQIPGMIALWRLLRRERHELAGAHFFSSQLFLAGPVAARWAGVPCIVTVTGFGRALSDSGYRLLQRPFWALFAHTLAYSRAVLFQNRHDLETTADRFPALRSKFRYVPSAIEFPAHSRSFDDGPLKVLSVGRLSLGKGVEDFLDTASRLAGSRFRFTLVGPPPRRKDRLALKVRQLADGGIIDYRGEVRGEALARIFGEHHVLLFPSRAEGLPRVMLEAGMSGLYPVAYDIPGTRDLVPAPENYLVPAFDKVALAEVLIGMEADRHELARRALAYQAFVNERFTADSYVQTIDDLLVETGIA